MGLSSGTGTSPSCLNWSIEDVNFAPLCSMKLWQETYDGILSRPVSQIDSSFPGNCTICVTPVAPEAPYLPRPVSPSNCVDFGELDVYFGGRCSSLLRPLNSRTGDCPVCVIPIEV